MRLSWIALSSFLLVSCGDKEDLQEDSGIPTGPTTPLTKPDDPTALPAGVELPTDQVGLVEALGDGSTAEPALERLVAMGADSVPALREVALSATDVGARGWAIQGLGRIDHPDAKTALDAILEADSDHTLIGTWAAAALIGKAGSLDAVLAYAPLVGSYPALKRPLGQKVEAYQGELTDVAGALTAMQSDSNLQAVLAPAVLARGAEPLLAVMLTHEQDATRRLAAGLLGTLANDDDSVIPSLAAAYDFDPKAETVPWKGGALYVPSLSWDRKEAKQIMAGMVAWHLFCDRKGLEAEKNQIYNNVRSVNLHRPAKFEWPQNDTLWLLGEYSRTTSIDTATELLRAQKVSHEQKYVDAVTNRNGRR